MACPNVSAAETAPAAERPANTTYVCATFFNTFQTSLVQIGSLVSRCRGRGGAVLAAREKRQDLLTISVVIGMLEQRFARARPRQVHAHDPADACVRAVRHHDDAV